ncbi:MAG: hypothetical protein HY862_10820 [Chloroflexi bacterium]|nr:hypothetical protein [Chloroflexota bacterium]
MNEQYAIGIDGGGTNLRVIVVRPDLTVVGRADAGTANPNVIGHDTSAALLQQTIRKAVTHAGLEFDQIDAVGIGVAGAPREFASEWLRQAVLGILPESLIVPSSDHEIALVGALGKREGVLILAGTGSVGYGINAAGESALVGGWGYLLGDEGSGYSLGMEALRALMKEWDGRLPETSLTEPILTAIGAQDIWGIVTWLYGDVVRTPEIAKLSPIVLEHAIKGDQVAQKIVERGVEGLAEHVETIKRRLGMDKSEIAFAGGLLTSDNLLSRTLCQRLGLSDIPQPRYTPVIGAALLALQRLKQRA